MHNNQSESVEYQAAVERLTNTAQSPECTLSARTSLDQSSQDIAGKCDNDVMSSVPSIEFIAQAWPLLSPHIREAIFTLIHASLPMVERKADRHE